MAEQAQHDLDEALPALAEAMKVHGLSFLKVSNFNFICTVTIIQFYTQLQIEKN